MLFTEIHLKYYHPGLNIGMFHLKSVWLLQSTPVQLHVLVYRGNLMYRIPKTRKRVSYATLKKGLLKTNIVIRQPLNILPF